jgi:hypothetical protein
MRATYRPTEAGRVALAAVERAEALEVELVSAAWRKGDAADRRPLPRQTLVWYSRMKIF